MYIIMCICGCATAFMLRTVNASTYTVPHVNPDACGDPVALSWLCRLWHCRVTNRTHLSLYTPHSDGAKHLSPSYGEGLPSVSSTFFMHFPTAHTVKPISESFLWSRMLRPSKMKAGFDIELKIFW